MNALTIGMIGFGSIARTHCMAVAAIAADTGLPVRIGKIYRRNRSLAAPFFSLGYAQTLEELISESDVVDICSTNDVHFEQAAQVIRAGKNCTWKNRWALTWPRPRRWPGWQGIVRCGIRSR